MKTIMKKIKFLYLIFLLLSFAACKKDYLNTGPTDQVQEADVFTTTNNALVALNGIHRIMWTQLFLTRNTVGRIIETPLARVHHILLTIFITALLPMQIRLSAV